MDELRLSNGLRLKSGSRQVWKRDREKDSLCCCVVLGPGSTQNNNISIFCVLCRSLPYFFYFFCFSPHISVYFSPSPIPSLTLLTLPTCAPIFPSLWFLPSLPSTLSISQIRNIILVHSVHSLAFLFVPPPTVSYQTHHSTIVLCSSPFLTKKKQFLPTTILPLLSCNLKTISYPLPLPLLLFSFFLLPPGLSLLLHRPLSDLATIPGSLFIHTLPPPPHL